MEKSVIRAKHVILISNKKQRWKCFLIEHRSQLFKCYEAEIVFLTWYKMDIMLKAWIQIENMFFHLQSSVSRQFSWDLMKEFKKKLQVFLKQNGIKSSSIYMWNEHVEKWDSCLVLSPHHKARLYISENIQVWKTLKFKII